MKKDHLRALDPAEQEQKLHEIGEQQFRIQFQMSMGQSEGLKKLREIRKDRARLLTYRRLRELEAVTQGGAAKEGAAKDGAAKKGAQK